MNYCELLATGIITFGATFWGVSLAIKADNDRERNNQIDHKTRLAKGLFWEMNKLFEFFNKTLNLEEGEDYFVEAHILRDTVGDQIKYFDNPELIMALSRLRLELKEIEYKLGIFSKINIESATQKFIREGDQFSWSGISSEIIKMWKMWQNNGQVYTAEVLKMIRKELPEIDFYKEVSSRQYAE